MEYAILILFILIILFIINRLKVNKKTMPAVITMSNYFKHWPEKGYYVNDLKKAYDIFLDYISNLYTKNLKNPAIVIDIDDTLLFADPLSEIGTDKRILPLNPYIWTFPFICRDYGIKTIILTARPRKYKKYTKYNLGLYNIPYDKLIMNKTNDSEFKIDERFKLREKYNIVAEIGDQWPDVSDVNDTLSIKLPAFNDPYLKIKKPFV